MGWLLIGGWKPDTTSHPIPCFRVVNPEADARGVADVLSGKVFVVSDTGSMKPLLQGGDYVVTKDDFDGVKVGMVLAYTADYHPRGLVHRVALVDEYGFLMSGDSAPISESWARVTKETYLGTVVAIYRKLP